ncbi:hypothetical protein PHMEG_00027019 [Phytophthora megakarya]|uniref:HTH CENPB-type domain-containing protein n=1 Tax=Phytophthora megakarya TaxID=4795 RepID=A0A225V8Y5_9STRA|nr:hypothetical protein PHMEG_00027019 [Phytophthora megakarya]
MILAVKGHEFAALSAKHNTCVETIRSWCKAEDRLKSALKDRQVATRVSRRLRLSGAGLKPGHLELEERLHDWLVARNSKGLRVKDSYIRLQVKTSIAVEGFRLHRDGLPNLNVVSRRQTTSRSLSDEAPNICREFIQQAQHLIEKHHINPCNVINMDQVPRYFEIEPKSTITRLKSSAIYGNLYDHRGGDERVLTPHLLFSKLNNKPACPPACKTGSVWTKGDTTFSEPVLHLIDSYGCHVKLAESK